VLSQHHTSQDQLFLRSSLQPRHTLRLARRLAFPQINHRPDIQAA
jgi:hypothetical protein